MTTLVIFLCIAAFLVWLGRLWRKREMAKFRDVDADMLFELRKDHPGEDSGATNIPPQAIPEAKSDLPVETSIDFAPDPLNLAVSPILRDSVVDERVQHLLTQLEALIAEPYRVLVNVSMQDVITTNSEAKVPLLVCDQHFRPQLALAFNGEIDLETSEIFQQAGLAFMRVEASETATHLKTRLMEVKPDLVKIEDEPGRCPNCYGAMNLRAPRSGKNAGKRYWLCKSYPRCKGVIPL